MPAKTAVRLATARDLPNLVHLWRELIGFDEALGGQDFRLARGSEAAWEKHLRAHLGKKDKSTFVGASEGRMVAFLVASLERPPGIFMEREYGEISAVYVREPYRGKGMGSALVEAAFAWFEGKRVSRVRVTTDTKNSLGVEFWKHRGFTPTVVTMDRLL
ncbi:MAG: GNAT family N-acetyltransferase [Thermoplasmata archaeon]